MLDTMPCYIVSIITLLGIVFSFSFSTAQTSYIEKGKTFHRPAQIETSELLNFSNYTPHEKKLVQQALQIGQKHKWLRYRFGGNDPSTGGFDCSGAMHYMLRKAGYQPPRTSAQQYLWVREHGKIYHVSSRAKSIEAPAFKHLRPGDLLFWSGTYRPTDGRAVKITHVSIYLGQEKDGNHVMACSTKGRTYRGKRGDGYGVYNFKLPRKGSRAKFVGYGKLPQKN